MDSNGAESLNIYASVNGLCIEEVDRDRGKHEVWSESDGPKFWPQHLCKNMCVSPVMPGGSICFKKGWRLFPHGEHMIT